MGDICLFIYISKPLKICSSLWYTAILIVSFHFPSLLGPSIWSSFNVALKLPLIQYRLPVLTLHNAFSIKKYCDSVYKHTTNEKHAQIKLLLFKTEYTGIINLQMKLFTSPRHIAQASLSHFSPLVLNSKKLYSSKLKRPLPSKSMTSKMSDRAALIKGKSKLRVCIVNIQRNTQ